MKVKNRYHFIYASLCFHFIPDNFFEKIGPKVTNWTVSLVDSAVLKASRPFRIKRYFRKVVFFGKNTGNNVMNHSWIWTVDHAKSESLIIDKYVVSLCLKWRQKFSSNLADKISTQFKPLKIFLFHIIMMSSLDFCAIFWWVEILTNHYPEFWGEMTLFDIQIMIIENLIL